MKPANNTLGKLAKMPQMGQKYQTTKKQLLGVRFFPISGFKKHLILSPIINPSQTIIHKKIFIEACGCWMNEYDTQLTTHNVKPIK